MSVKLRAVLTVVVVLLAVIGLSASFANAAERIDPGSHPLGSQFEAGAVFFTDGSCVEADGTWGLAEASGQCVTPADYDIIFGYENLASVENASTPGVSVADAYGITADEVRASDRRSVFMGVDYGTFNELVVRVSGNVAL